MPNLDFYAADDDWPEVLHAVFDSGLFRYTCEGWGLIQLHYGGPFGAGELRWSHTNHNTGKRAAAWAPTVPRIGDPAMWDWKAVASASGKLNRAIRRLAVDKITSHPVLPHAARLIAEAGLRDEYGVGIHAQHEEVVRRVGEAPPPCQDVVTGP